MRSFYLICLYWIKVNIYDSEFEKVRLEKSCHVSHDGPVITKFSACLYRFERWLIEWFAAAWWLVCEVVIGASSAWKD
jgi:hypothetical protein